ncbi:MAG: response regulator [Ferruginibacter sp.]
MSQITVADKKLKKVLIIEDEGDVCLILNIMLKGKNIDLEHVNSIARAKDYLNKEIPSLILLDNKLPDGLGMDFIQFIKKNHPTVKILMISGFHPDLTKDIALTNGADLYLEKPFTKEQVFQSVQTLLN